MKSNLICKSCSNSKIIKVYDFGMMPPVNSYLEYNDISLERLFPLVLYVCEKCWLMQLGEVPDPKILYSNYHHISGASKGNKDHLKQVSKYINSNYPLSKSILEIGCNDGTLLNFLDDLGYESIGVDPAKNISQRESIKIYKDFFGSSFSKKLKKPIIILI